MVSEESTAVMLSSTPVKEVTAGVFVNANDPLFGINTEGISLQIRMFIVEYLTGDHKYNATKSAIAAGYSAKTAASSASRILAKQKVKDVIKAFHERAEALAVNKLRDWKDLAPAAQKTISEIADGTMKSSEPFELQVRLNASKELLDRAYGKVANKNEITGKDGTSLIPMDVVRKAIATAEGDKE